MSENTNSWSIFQDDIYTSSLLLSDNSLIKIEDDMFNNKQYKYNKGIRIKDESYFMKQSGRYSLDCYTEHIASTFIRECGYSAQQTMMGMYRNSPVVICKDFTDEYGILETFNNTSPYRLDGASLIYEYDIDYLIRYFKDIKNCNVDDCVIKLWEMCLFDVLLHTDDRHCGNGGLCYKNGVRVFSPLFDNAESLYSFIFEYSENNRDITPDCMISHCFAYSWFEYRHKKECPKDVLAKFQEIDVVSAIDRSTIGFKDSWRSFFRSIVYYRHKCLIKGDEFVCEGMK